MEHMLESKWRSRPIEILEAAGRLIGDNQLTSKVGISPQDAFLSKNKRWARPPVGTYKLNVDGAVKEG